MRANKIQTKRTCELAGVECPTPDEREFFRIFGHYPSILEDVELISTENDYIIEGVEKSVSLFEEIKQHIQKFQGKEIDGEFRPTT